jgi:hypothetical protein
MTGALAYVREKRKWCGGESDFFTPLNGEQWLVILSEAKDLLS